MSQHGYTLHIDDGVARFELDQPERANVLSAGFWHAFPRDVAALAVRGDLCAAPD